MNAPLRLELERAALRALFRSYEHLNASLFRRSLRGATIALCDAGPRLGRWSPDSRTIELSRELLERQGWGALEEVLKHEMAHQYVDEVLQVRDETAHGPAFRRVCEERAIDARAAGAPMTAAGDAAQPILDRIAKLLSLAESPNEHEAQAAMMAAQRLMLKHNLEAALASTGQYCFRHLGSPNGRTPEHERRLAMILDRHFFVQVIWVPVWRAALGKRGSVLEVCGERHNVELAEYVHGFLLHTAQALYEEDRRRRQDRSHAQRRRFLAGVMSGFHERLERERKKSEAEGLIWIGSAEVTAYFRRRHPHVRWARHSVSTSGEAYQRGQKAGRNIVLRQGVGGSAASAPRLLPPRS